MTLLHNSIDSSHQQTYFNLRALISYNMAKTVDEARKILQVSNSSCFREVRRTFLKLASKHHPDKNANACAMRMQEINNAYECLCKQLVDVECMICGCSSAIRFDSTMGDFWCQQCQLAYPDLYAPNKKSDRSRSPHNRDQKQELLHGVMTGSFKRFGFVSSSVAEYHVVRSNCIGYRMFPVGTKVAFRVKQCGTKRGLSLACDVHALGTSETHSALVPPLTDQSFEHLYAVVRDYNGAVLSTIRTKWEQAMGHSIDLRGNGYVSMTHCLIDKGFTVKESRAWCPAD